RLPPRSPLFPYTTLFRSAQPGLARVIVEVDGVAKRRTVDGDDSIARAQTRPRGCASGAHGGDEDACGLARSAAGHARRTARPGRSEEHTSELQSLAYLVC